MTHDRIKVSKRVTRLNVSYWIQGKDGKQYRLQAAIETVSYGTSQTFYVCDAEGLYFTDVLPLEGWGQPMYEAIRTRLQCVFRLDETGIVAMGEGMPVIPEQKLSTGLQ
jgi:hypothetical protein